MTGANIAVDGKTNEYPVLSGTIGPDVIDIRKLYGQTGAFTFDPGFTSTAACESKITYIDGDIGTLLYRGYPIDQLAEKSSFLEVANLLLNGELPTPEGHAEFKHLITRHTMIHEQLAQFYRGFRRDAHPMAIMCGIVGAMAAFYHDSTDIRDPKQRVIAAHRLIAKMPTLAAMAYKYSIGQPFLYPDNSLSFSGNFLRMTFGVPAEEYVVDPVIEDAMEKLLILQADHEQNASTSTVRLAGSSGANPFACIAAGIACLWGPAHGGANEAALNMLREIGTVDRIPEFIARAKNKDDPFRLMGFGHRVYKNYDPPREGHAGRRQARAGQARRQRPGIRRGPRARADRAQRPVLHREEAVPERRLLLGRRDVGDRLPDLDVHGAVRGVAHRWLDRAVGGNDRGPRPENRPPAPAVQGSAAARLRRPQRAIV